MSACELTIIIVNDAEKDAALLRYCLQALGEDAYNGEAVRDRCQLIILNQDPLEDCGSRIADCGLGQNVQWFDAGHRVVGGAVLWDLVESLRLLRPRIRGRYLMLLHKEMICSPGAIAGLLDHAQRTAYPDIVLHNLRRPGTLDDLRDHGQVQCSAEYSAQIRRSMDAGEPPVPAAIPDLHWLPARNEQATFASERFIEDVFAARLGWLDAVRFFDHGSPHLYFQDVYDLVGAVDAELLRRDLAPTVRRLPLSAGRIWHLHHPRQYPALRSEAVQAYLAGGLGSGQVAGTLLSEPQTFEGVRQWVAAPGGDTVRHHRHPRHSTGGTVDRYRRDLCRWLDAGGQDAMRDYYGRPSPALARRERILPVGPGPVCVLAHNHDVKNPLHPLHHVACGLKAAAIRFEVLHPPHGAYPWPLLADRPGAVITWNAAKDARADIAARFRSEGVPVFVMERGFFARTRYSQLDPCGFNHTASWATREQLSCSPPPEGQARFVGAFGTPPFPIRPRERGGILVLGQVPGDAQLADAEVSDSEDLLEHVLSALDNPQSAIRNPQSEVRYRPHPLTPAGRQNDVSLHCDIDYARFVVTINSNAIHEALAWGCPVLALGPAVACIAGVAMQTTLAGLPQALAKMLDGWAPPPDAVRDYLYHLACRQHSNVELAAGDLLRTLLGR